MATKNIFICYRRDDAEGYPRLLRDRLNARFPGRIFMDVTNIAPGSDFTAVIQDRVGSCHALIAVIGKSWLATDSSGQRRIDHQEDYVRREIASALSRNHIAVIPVLVRKAEMPTRELLPPEIAPLSTRNAIEITEEDFDHDVQRLIQALEFHFGETYVPPPPKTASRRTCLIFAIVGILAAGAIVFVLFLLGLLAASTGSTGGGNGTSPQPVYTTPSEEPAVARPAVVSQFPVGHWRLQATAVDGSQSAADLDIFDNGTYQSSSGPSGNYSYSGGTLELRNWGVITFQSRSGNGYVGVANLTGVILSVELIPR
jgi:hypothetical protein